MRILSPFLLIISTVFSYSFGFYLKCAEIIDIDDIISCIAYDLVITTATAKITSVNSDTDPKDNIHRLEIQNENVNFVPKNIEYFFPELEELVIFNSSLEWIEQENIRELTNLKTLNLAENKLEILENGLFDFNTKLETINIEGNKLNFVYKEIFYNLNNLRILDLGNNECTQTMYYGSRFSRYSQDAYSYRNQKRLENLQLEKEILEIQLTNQLKTCDENFDAALANFHQQKLINANTLESVNKPKDSVKLILECEDSICEAVNFNVAFANLSIENEVYKYWNITSIRIHQQPAIFLPQNLADHFSNLSKLSVIECGLYEIEFSVFEGLDLLNLNLTQNKILEVPVDTFKDLENLQELDLSFNKIRTLHDDVFVSLKSLQNLYLNNNFLSVINIELLRNLESLNVLFLQGNQLKFIGATLLSPLTSLKLVDLSGNVCINMSHPTSSLLDIEATIIDNCIEPVELSCKSSRNETSENGGIDDSFCNVQGMFIEYPKTKISKLNGGGANSLVKVFFSENQSTKFFPFQLSHQLPNLERIEMQKSKLTALHPMDFDGFSKLTEIVMNQNNLSTISQGSFDTIPQLELLDLSSNNIVFLPTKIFAKLTHLHTLILSNNQIVRFTADLLPRKNVIDAFSVDNNRLEFIETKTIRFLRKAKLIDLTNNVCIDRSFPKPRTVLEHWWSFQVKSISIVRLKIMILKIFYMIPVIFHL